MKFSRSLTITVLTVASFSLVGMEELPTKNIFLRTQQEKGSAVIEFGSDEKGDLLSITSKAVYAIGNEGKNSGLIKEFKLEYSDGDRITMGSIIYENAYGGRIFSSDDGKRIAVIIRNQVTNVEVFEDDQSSYMFSFCLDSKYARKAVFSRSGAFVAVIECNNEVLYSCTLYRLLKKSPPAPLSIWALIKSYFSGPMIIGGEKIIDSSSTPIEAAAFNDTATSLAVGNGKEVYLCKFDSTNLQKKSLYKDNNQITNINFGPRGGYVFITSEGEFTVKMVNVNTQQHVANFIGSNFAIKELRVGTSYFGDIIAARGKNQHQESEVCIWLYKDALKGENSMQKNIYRHLIESDFVDLMFE